MGRYIDYKDQDFGGSFNAHKNWKKLREKHKKHKASGRDGPCTPEVYTAAGKGDAVRNSSVPKEIYSLNYELAFNRITKEEHAQKTEEFWENYNT